MDQDNFVDKFANSPTNSQLPDDVVTSLMADMARWWEELLVSDDPTFIFMQSRGLKHAPPPKNSKYFQLW